MSWVVTVHLTDEQLGVMKWRPLGLTASKTAAKLIADQAVYRLRRTGYAGPKNGRSVTVEVKRVPNHAVDMVKFLAESREWMDAA